MTCPKEGLYSRGALDWKSGGGWVLEGSKAIGWPYGWLLSLSMYEAGSAFQLWLFSFLFLYSRAVGENIWKGFPGTGENFQANEALPAQLGTPTPAICSRCHYRVCERNLAVSSSSEGASCPGLGAGWEPGFLGTGACPFPFSLSLLGSMTLRSSMDALRVSPRPVMKGEAALVVRSSTVSPEFSPPH